MANKTKPSDRWVTLPLREDDKVFFLEDGEIMIEYNDRDRCFYIYTLERQAGKGKRKQKRRKGK